MGELVHLSRADDPELAKAAAEATADLRAGELYKLEATVLDIINEEITRLDERRQAETDPAVLELLDSLYDQKTAEAEAFHADYEAKADSVLKQTIRKIGSHRPHPHSALRRTHPHNIHDDSVEAAA